MSQKCIINNLRQKNLNFYQKKHKIRDTFFMARYLKNVKKKKKALEHLKINHKKPMLNKYQ